MRKLLMVTLIFVLSGVAGIWVFRTEGRIAHVPDAFERSSTSFKSAWEDFKECSSHKDCDSTKSIIPRRDKAIAKDWQIVFDQLVDSEKWGENFETALAHKDFQEALEKYGHDKLRNHCVPNIEFRRTGFKPSYVMRGYTCDQKPGQSGRV